MPCLLNSFCSWSMYVAKPVKGNEYKLRYFAGSLIFSAGILLQMYDGMELLQRGYVSNDKVKAYGTCAMTFGWSLFTFNDWWTFFALLVTGGAAFAHKFKKIDTAD